LAARTVAPQPFFPISSKDPVTPGTAKFKPTIELILVPTNSPTSVMQQDGLGEFFSSDRLIDLRGL
jgi:hypothetical protein